MKPGILAVLLSFALVGGVAIAMVGGRSRSADAARSEALLAESTARQAELSQTIDQLTDQVTRLSRRVRSLEESGGSRLAAGVEGEEAVASSDEEAPDGAPAAAESAEPKVTLQQVLQPEHEKMLREYVAQVYLDARNQRKEDEQKQAEEKRKEWEALGEGPYGDNNRRVNTLGKAFGWNDLMKDRYNSVLSSYLERQKAIRGSFDLRDPESRKEMRRQEKLLGDEFDRVVATMLTPEQTEIYADLPPDQKGLGPSGDGRIIRTLQMEDGGVMLKTVDFVGDGAPAEVKIEADLRAVAEHAAAAAAAAAAGGQPVPPPPGAGGR